MSVRLGIRSMAERWERTTGKLGRDDRDAGNTLTRLMKSHSSEAFFGCDTVLEAGLFSALIEIQKNQEDEGHVDP